ncbi:uncharacterized protein J7T54_005562 [Emericellopsis cladophorae]|uniref:DUF985 domain-containing protein n=1 Tax=Emericellopsis cladophorae TaxID=2686198 RepID=A0A9P9Y5N1_9HYPO|nr:uncharacterized protein J7T54_005562 [Emericellopsis cladophorae]KAI6783533.1 hypothetical protein J7T54_005562 [Emericellopsis cladophorae]
MGNATTSSDPSLPPLEKPNVPTPPAEENARVQSTIKTLNLIPHIEGGYFQLSDSSPRSIPSPYAATPLSEDSLKYAGAKPAGDTRLMNTSIFYYLTPNSPKGSFHRNRSRIIHTLHRGRGRYVVIHEDKSIETFVVGNDIEKGERLQWVVEGGSWKASFLLDDGADEGNFGLLITETVVPGFDYSDHEFMSQELFEETVDNEEDKKQLRWLIKQDYSSST